MARSPNGSCVTFAVLESSVTLGNLAPDAAWRGTIRPMPAAPPILNKSLRDGMEFRIEQARIPIPPSIEIFNPSYRNVLCRPPQPSRNNSRLSLVTRQRKQELGF